MKTAFTFNVSETDLYAQYWQPEEVKSVIVLVHGMGEHSGRYEESVVKYLVENCYAVIAFDLFGHGKSKGKRGHCPSYNALLEAIDQIIKKSEVLFINKPIILYGHSLGGNLVLNYAIRNKNNLKAVIATSPFLRLAFQPPKWKTILGKLMLKIMPSITLQSEIETKAISNIESEVLRYETDELVHDLISPMYLFPVIEAGEYAIAQAKKIKIPTILFHGKADRIIDYKGSVDFNKNSEHCKLHLFKNGYHELHHDIYKEVMLESIVKWLDNL